MPVYQELVFFESYPSLDSERLRECLVSYEPLGEAEVSVSAFEELEALPPEGEALQAVHGSVQASTATLRLGELEMKALLFDRPALHADCIGASPIADEEKELLTKHGAHALLTLTGGDSAPAIERILFLLKAGLAMCEQGALGIGNEINLTAYPGEFLLGIVGESAAEGEPIWTSLRQEGIPVELLVNFFLTHTHRQHWCFSAGNELFGFPDFACQVGKAEELEIIQEVFFDAFLFQFQHGPVIEPGQRFGSEETGLYRFDPPREDQEFLQQENGVLVVRRVTDEEL